MFNERKIMKQLKNKDTKALEKIIRKYEKLSFTFEKYPSEVIPNQQIEIGYIKNNMLANNTIVNDQLTGKYILTADEDAEYYIFVRACSSDPITLKKGKITIIKYKE